MDNLKKYVFARQGGASSGAQSQKEQVEIARGLGAATLKSFAHPNSEKQLGIERKYVFAGDAPYGEAPATEQSASRLLSYAQSNLSKDMEPFKGGPCAVYIDSGAYSAWTRGIAIDLGEYCEFLHNWKDVITYAFNLDCIPGQKGQPASVAEIEAACVAGMQNWRAMRSRGLHTIHTYHAGEPLALLSRIVDEALAEMPEPYIAIGGAARLEETARFEWLCGAVWPALVDNDGVPKLKVHGLGTTDLRTVLAFPWQSVDSTSWLFTCSQGKIYLWRDGAIRSYYASERHRQGWHGYSEVEKQAIQEALQQDCRGFASLPAKEQFLLLMRHNIRELKKIEGMIPTTFNRKKRGQQAML